MYLRQSTASQEILLGPFVDDTDGKTAETGLTIANTDIKLFVHGATTEANKTSGGATHIAGGRYYAVLDATDTATLGILEVNVHVSGALPVRRAFTVLPANVYDSLIAGSDLLDTSLVQIAGDAQSGTDLKDFADAGYDPATNKVQGVVLVDTLTTYTGNTVQTGDSYAIVNGASGLVAVKNQVAAIEVDTQDIQGRIPAALVSGRIDASVGAMAANVLTASALATDAVTEVQSGLATSAALATVDGIVDDILVDTAAIPTAAAIADAVWDEAIAGHASAGSTGLALSSAGSAGDPWSTAIPGAYSAGTAGYIVGNNLDAAVSSAGGGGSTLIVHVGEYYVATGDSLMDFQVDTVDPDTGVATTFDDLTLELFVNGILNGASITWTEIAEGRIQLAGTLPTIAPGDRLSIKASSVTAVIEDQIVWYGIGPTNGSGTGARTVTITVNDGTTALQAANVRFTQGIESYVQSTNASGIATFNLDDATWTVSITKAGYSYAGTTLVVNGTEAQTYSMTAVTVTPSDPGATTAYVTVRDSAGAAAPDITVQVEVMRFANGTTGSGIDNPLATGTTDADGYVEFVGLPRLATYRVRIGEGEWFKGVTADAATTPMAGVLGVAE